MARRRQIKLQRELEQRYNKVNGEKEEVIAALEDVIHEVQSREEEIESLASILRKRDEELDHAKLIATKALASAQDMKNRFKEKGGHYSAKNNELKNKVEHLNEQIEFLSKKNENLQRRISQLEGELQYIPKDKIRSSGSSVSSNTQQIQSLNSATSSMKGLHNGVSVDENGFALMDEISDTFPCWDDPTISPTSLSTDQSKNSGKQAPFDETEINSVSNSTHTTGWLHEFGDSDSAASSNHNSFEEARSEPGMSQSRRSLERDALRKYVRKKYLKSQATSSR